MTENIPYYSVRSTYQHQSAPLSRVKPGPLDRESRMAFESNQVRNAETSE